MQNFPNFRKFRKSEKRFPYKFDKFRGNFPRILGENRGCFFVFYGCNQARTLQKWRFFRGSRKISPRDTFLHFREFREFREFRPPKNGLFYRIRSAQQGTLREIRGIFGVFSDIFGTKKLSKIVQNHQKNTPKNTPKFSGGFREIPAANICRKVKKGSKIPPGSPEFPEFAQICTNFFPEFSGGIFGDF